MSEVLVVDEFIGKIWQEEIKSLLLGDSFPWFYTPNVTHFRDKNQEQNCPACYHLFRFNSSTTSQHFQYFLPMAYSACEIAGKQFNDVNKCRSFLQYPLSEKYLKNTVDDLHVDLYFDHLVLLYYVLDSDGDTIIVDKRYQENEIVEDLNVNNHRIVAKVTPKQGRAVIFDGRLYHTAEQPRDNVRCVINFDIT
jgi:hypothetical protein